MTRQTLVSVGCFYRERELRVKREKESKVMVLITNERIQRIKVAKEQGEMQKWRAEELYLSVEFAVAPRLALFAVVPISARERRTCNAVGPACQRLLRR